MYDVFIDYLNIKKITWVKWLFFIYPHVFLSIENSLPYLSLIQFHWYFSEGNFFQTGFYYLIF